MTRIEFAKQLLKRLGYPQTTGNYLALVAWQSAENTKAKWNPLGTTQPWPNATNFNSTGVKNYRTSDDGINATVKTLRNGKYNPVLTAMAAGTSGRAVVQAVANSPWGTGSLATRQYDFILEKYVALGEVVISS